MAPRDPQDMEDELVFTGERFIPHQTNPLLALEHYHRYYLASRLVQHKKVLDCACGEGYGSAFLSKFAQSVVGFDIDRRAVEHARKKYSAVPNVTFEVGNCENAPAGGEFDVAVGFELIEHLDSDAQVRFLKNIRRVLKPDGLFLVSSPERIEYAETYNRAGNEYHKHEMTLPELTEFLGRYFSHILLCAQRVLTLSAIWQLSDWRETPFRFHAVKDLVEEIPAGGSFFPPLYLVALCSNAPVPQTVFNESNSLYLDAANSDQTKTFSNWAQQLNREALQNRERITALQQQLEERSAWAANLNSLVNIKDESIQTLQKELGERTAWALSLESEVAMERAHAEKPNRLWKEVSESTLYRVLAKLGMLPRLSKL